MARDLGNYIQRQLKKGYTPDEIRAALQKAGYDDSAITEAAKRPVAYLIAAIGIIVLLIAGTVGYLFPILPKEVSVLATEFDTTFSDAYYFVLAQKTNDLSQCEKMSTPLACLAAVKKDPALCAQLSDFERQDCVFFATKNLTACPYLAEYCQAIVTGDPSHCGIPGEMQVFIDSCKAEATLDETYFLTRTEESLGRAIAQVAYEHQNPRYCFRIREPEYKTLCEAMT